MIAPLFDQLPSKYPRAIFLKVDVDKCQDTASQQGVSAMPTFVFYRNKVNIVCSCYYIRLSSTYKLLKLFNFFSQKLIEFKVLI